ncbi:HlyD family secretion protein [Phenylobacterium sp.]|jgi:HlyD family secretion protein|uniref:HlyD family secretion protein n=1 Tax=Phenylobacterium sp. TaxID=1871053 RepID=UPI002F419CDC
MAMAPEAPARAQRRIPARAVAVAALILVAAGLVWFFVAKSGHKSNVAFTGYVVSDNVYMSSPVSGTLTAVAVKRGARVAAGQLLFRVDPTVRAAQADQARAQIAGAQAAVAQQEGALAQAKANVAAAQADADRSEAQARRLAGAQGEKPGSVAQLQLDQAQAAYKAALDKRDAASAQLRSASAAVDASRAQVRQAEAGLTSAQRQLSDLAPVAPGAGRIDDIMFKPGESVAANAPVISIVPDGEVRVRFYVSEAQVNAFKPGRRVAIACDGCAAGMTATVDFVASRPEYTPPVIYSLDARQKLVFMVEALPSDPRALVPGQPMDVAPSAKALPCK